MNDSPYWPKKKGPKKQGSLYETKLQPRPKPPIIKPRPGRGLYDAG